jgi:hypothetical protein
MGLVILALVALLFISTARSSGELGHLRSQLTTTTWHMGNATEELNGRDALIKSLGEKSSQLTKTEKLLLAVSAKEKAQVRQVSEKNNAIKDLQS